jgi:hypothetical protein
MKHLRGNWLLGRIILIYALYVGIGLAVPRPHMFSAVAILATIGGTILFARYAREAWQIIWNQERGAYGAHHAVLGATEVGMGLMYLGLYRLVWNQFGQPDTWQATWFSSLGLFMVAKGVFRQGTSPSDDLLLGGLPRRFWNWLMISVGLMLAFLAGMHFNG